MCSRCSPLYKTVQAEEAEQFLINKIFNNGIL